MSPEQPVSVLLLDLWTFVFISSRSHSQVRVHSARKGVCMPCCCILRVTICMQKQGARKPWRSRLKTSLWTSASSHVTSSALRYYQHAIASENHHLPCSQCRLGNQAF